MESSASAMDAWERLRESRVGILATAGAGGVPHAVPCCYALSERTLYSAVDAKPKRTRQLRRLTNLSQNPAAALLVQRWSEDWTQLWWVRADGRGRIVDDPAEKRLALDLLLAKYDQYRRLPPEGPVLALDIAGIASWSWR